MNQCKYKLVRTLFNRLRVDGMFRGKESLHWVGFEGVRRAGHGVKLPIYGFKISQSYVMDTDELAHYPHMIQIV